MRVRMMIFRSDSQRRAAFANMFSRKGSTWLVFGDSIAMGYNDKKGGWVERLKRVVYPEPVYNLGVDGDGIDDVADRISEETERRLKSVDNAKIIIAVGINDAAGSSSDGIRFGILLDAAESVLDKRNITVLGLTPVDDSKTNPVAWDEDVSYTDERVKELDDAIRKACDRKGVSYMSMHDRLSPSDLDDGLHPNASGHDKIFNVIRDIEAS